MIRHDLLVQTAAPRYRPPGPAALSVAKNAVMPTNPTKIAFSRTSNLPERRPLDAPGKLGAAALGTHPTTPK